MSHWHTLKGLQVDPTVHPSTGTDSSGPWSSYTNISTISSNDGDTNTIGINHNIYASKSALVSISNAVKQIKKDKAMNLSCAPIRIRTANGQKCKQLLCPSPLHAAWSTYTKRWRIQALSTIFGTVKQDWCPFRHLDLALNESLKVAPCQAPWLHLKKSIRYNNPSPMHHQTPTVTIPHIQ